MNTDFFVGYSPERINPGDKEHTVSKILKVTSGSTPEAATIIDQLYNSVITAGTFKAASIKVAEAAKVIENSQRDINIAFVNELSKIFNRLGIDTHEVLEAAGTKWNFLPFKPGLVGGHCIGVDPYYLAQKAQEVGISSRNYSGRPKAQ
jgi:UDP-N-acetyl-D-galactosamine dehydrogenase